MSKTKPVKALPTRSVTVTKSRPPQSSPSRFIVPISGAYDTTSGFNDSRNYSYAPNRLQLHEGIDFAPRGSSPAFALSTASGRVSRIGNDPRGYGNYVEVDHGGGISTLYGHLADIAVTIGQYVTQGLSLGRVGNTGNSTGTHLHFSVQDRNQPRGNYVYPNVVNPLSLLSQVGDTVANVVRGNTTIKPPTSRGKIFAQNPTPVPTPTPTLTPTATPVPNVVTTSNTTMNGEFFGTNLIPDVKPTTSSPNFIAMLAGSNPAAALGMQAGMGAAAAQQGINQAIETGVNSALTGITDTITTTWRSFKDGFLGQIPLLRDLVSDDPAVRTFGVGQYIVVMIIMGVIAIAIAGLVFGKGSGNKVVKVVSAVT